MPYKQMATQCLVRLVALRGLSPATVAQCQALRAEAGRLLKAILGPARWPTEEQLREAKEQMRGGARLSADEFRQALLDG